jgi:hypothetical protein
MDTCKDCKHWSNRTWTDMQECQFDDAEMPKALRFHAYAQANDSYGMEYGIVTGPDFGCIHFTPRKKKG